MQVWHRLWGREEPRGNGGLGAAALSLGLALASILGPAGRPAPFSPRIPASNSYPPNGSVVP